MKRRLRCDHFAVGKQVHTALEAAEQLAAQGIEAEVIDPRSLSPLDEEAILTSVEKQIGLSLWMKQIQGAELPQIFLLWLRIKGSIYLTLQSKSDGSSYTGSVFTTA